MAKFSAVALFLLALIAISMLQPIVEASHNRYYGPGSVRRSQCPRECSRRCRKVRPSLQDSCKFFCNKCCRTCLCVPPGYYGYKQLCPCYNNWKTQRGGPKCP